MSVVAAVRAVDAGGVGEGVCGEVMMARINKIGIFL